MDIFDLLDDPVQRCGHQLVHRRRLVAFNEMRLVTIPAQQLFQFLPADAGQNGRVGDFISVQVQDRQHGPIVDRIEKFVRVPTRCQRSGLRLAITHHTSDEQIRIVKRGPIGVCQRIAKFPSFMDRAGSLGSNMARDAAGERKLREQPFHASFVLRDIRIELAVASLQIRVGDHRRTPVPGPRDEYHVQVPLLDDAVQMNIEEI